MTEHELSTGEVTLFLDEDEGLLVAEISKP